MGFWGLEVKPKEPQVYNPKNEQGKLHLTQATLGAGSGKETSVIQCSVGDNAPIYLCSLLPNKNECCPLNLEFDDEDETVKFSVTGDRSIHLSGYMEDYEVDYEQEEDEDDDSDGIDIGESESGESSDFDSEDDESEFEDLFDSSADIFGRSSVPNSGVVIEEIEDEETPTEDTKTKRPKKNANKQIDVNGSPIVPDMESEDEDGLPIHKVKAIEPAKMDIDDEEQGSSKKRKVKASEQDGAQESANKNKKKKNQKQKKDENASNEEGDEKAQTGNVQEETVTNAMSESSKGSPDKSAEKKKKKKKKNKSSAEATVESETIAEKSNSKASQERTYPNGLVVQEISMGKPKAKRASPGNQVSVRYIGKLQKNGKIFDSNINRAPFKFRLGVGQVIKGWDVGVNGMRVGDKRKLTIPPQMGYGQKGSRPDIPPNAWLEFDVELIDVR
ncbi:unnamed protein product [Cochlearia groenlandica]